MNRETVEKRLQELRAEFDSGQAQMTALEARKAELENTLLRISGAIQVLEEVLADQAKEG